jgi:predicted transglutaminase-like cysteine proteinase
MRPSDGLRRGCGVVAAIAMLLAQTVSTAAPSGEPHMHTGRPTLAPMAFIVFCQKMPSRCEPPASIETVTLTPEKRAQLQSVHREVNSTIRFKSDPPNVELPWREGAKVGDCDDYAMTKRGRLLDLGWPMSALLLAVAAVPTGEYHLVLVVVTDVGDLVLDNLRAEPVPWHVLPYRWIKRSTPKDPQAWVELTPVEPNAVVALAGCASAN